MDEQKISYMLFNDVLPSIASGSLSIEGVIYNVRFNTILYDGSKSKYIGDIYNEDFPTLAIKDVDRFLSMLLKCVDKMINSEKKGVNHILRSHQMK